MHVSNLQQFLRLLAPPLSAAGINRTAEKSVTDSLTGLADALEPFREMSTDQLAELVRLTQEYRQNGQFPDWVFAKKPGAAKTRAPRAPKAPKISSGEVVTRLRDLQERATELDATQISEEMRAFGSLTVDELKTVQREFLGGVIGKKKPELLEAIEKRIHDVRQSRERVEGILAN
jgi:hypothetical protein